MQNKKQLKVLFVSSEVSPYAKTGGLADVAGSLPHFLVAMGYDVRIVMPKYKSIKAEMKYVVDFPVQMDWKKEACIVRETQAIAKNGDSQKSVPVYFIDNYHYFDRDGIYCFGDDGERYAFFCNAILEMLPEIDFQPDIIHCNDWHSGPICMLLKEKYQGNPFYKNIATVYTVHNLQYQGLFGKEMLNFFQVGEHVLWPMNAEFYGSFNFMKAGLVYCDIINTVSEAYAREIQTEQYGEKLDGLLRERARDLHGIVNGIDYHFFNPMEDPSIYKNFSLESIEGKKENKYHLQERMGLPKKDVPVLGLISRLTGQKGINLILEVIDQIFQHDVQFVLLGEGDPAIENAFRDIRNRYPEKMGIYIGFDAGLAQQIYAGSDMFLMPSLFEPCGLGQIISFRYGTIPIVRATGGLAETVIDYNENITLGTGFSFNNFSSLELINTIQRALDVYNKEPENWDMLVKRALNLDFSWKKSAEKYVQLYQLATSKKNI